MVKQVNNLTRWGEIRKLTSWKLDLTKHGVVCGSVVWQPCHVSKCGIRNPVRHWCETCVRGNFGVSDRIMLFDSKNLSLTLNVKWFNGFHITSEEDPHLRCIEDDWQKQCLINTNFSLNSEWKDAWSSRYYWATTSQMMQNPILCVMCGMQYPWDVWTLPR